MQLGHRCPKCKVKTVELEIAKTSRVIKDKIQVDKVKEHSLSHVPIFTSQLVRELRVRTHWMVYELEAQLSD